MIDIPKLLRGLEKGTDLLRIRILTVLAKIDAVPDYVLPAEVVDRVSAFVNDPEPSVKYHARRALAHLRARLGLAGTNLAADPATPGFATPDEAERLLSDPDYVTRLKTAKELAHTGDRRWLPLIAGRLAEERNPFVLASLVKAFGQIGGTADIPAIVPFLAHADARVRANAIEGLAFIGDTSIVERVRPMLEDPDNRVVANAAMTLGLFNAYTFLGPMERMLKGTDSAMKESAIHALREFGGREGLVLLIGALSQADPDPIKRRALLAIEHLFERLAAREKAELQERVRAAVAILAPESEPPVSEDPFEVAFIYETMELYEDAIREYKRVLRSRPGNLPLIRRIRDCIGKREGK